MKTVVTALKAFMAYSLILGLGYPLFITAVARIGMPGKADGSLLALNGAGVGSALIGQEFSGEQYFHGRPSAVGYDAAASGASNLGPTSKRLMERVAVAVRQAREENGVDADVPLPADMVLAPASGLDPHISPANALLQAGRVARARGMEENELRKMIEHYTEGDFAGMWGRQGVNVLRINLALDTPRR